MKTIKLTQFPFLASIDMDSSKISKIEYGGIRYSDVQMQLPKPTGKFSVGRSSHYYNQSDTDRPIVFEIWYPAVKNTGELLNKQSLDVTKASADFHGWPLLHASYFASIKSNSYSNAVVPKGESFPVLLYNHGYSGYTSVYQTVFEELVSHGYIVVSIGHKNESALFIKENGEVIQNDPDNEFFTSRASELNGNKINPLQSVILNSNDKNAVKNAYKEYIKLSPLHTESVELWAIDTKQVIKKLEQLNNDGKYKDIFDFNNIGVFGHSVGGAVAGELAWSYHNIKAGINLDGFQFGNLINNTIEIPFMFVSSNQSDNTYLRISPFSDKAKAPVYHAVLKGFSHDNFSDLVFILNQNENYVNIQRNLILSFFNMYLKGQEMELSNLSKTHPEIKISSD